jgi:hypothetical protein
MHLLDSRSTCESSLRLGDIRSDRLFPYPVDCAAQMRRKSPSPAIKSWMLSTDSDSPSSHANVVTPDPWKPSSSAESSPTAPSGSTDPEPSGAETQAWWGDVYQRALATDQWRMAAEHYQKDAENHRAGREAADGRVSQLSAEAAALRSALVEAQNATMLLQRSHLEQQAASKSQLRSATNPPLPPTTTAAETVLRQRVMALESELAESRRKLAAVNADAAKDIDHTVRLKNEDELRELRVKLVDACKTIADKEAIAKTNSVEMEENRRAATEAVAAKEATIRDLKIQVYEQERAVAKAALDCQNDRRLAALADAKAYENKRLCDRAEAAAKAAVERQKVAEAAVLTVGDRLKAIESDSKREGERSNAAETRCKEQQEELAKLRTLCAELSRTVVNQRQTAEAAEREHAAVRNIYGAVFGARPTPPVQPYHTITKKGGTTNGGASSGNSGASGGGGAATSNDRVAASVAPPGSVLLAVHATARSAVAAPTNPNKVKRLIVLKSSSASAKNAPEFAKPTVFCAAKSSKSAAITAKEPKEARQDAKKEKGKLAGKSASKGASKGAGEEPGKASVKDGGVDSAVWPGGALRYPAEFNVPDLVQSLRLRIAELERKNAPLIADAVRERSQRIVELEHQNANQQAIIAQQSRELDAIGSKTRARSASPSKKDTGPNKSRTRSPPSRSPSPAGRKRSRLNNTELVGHRSDNQTSVHSNSCTKSNGQTTSIPLPTASVVTAIIPVLSIPTTGILTADASSFVNASTSSCVSPASQVLATPRVPTLAFNRPTNPFSNPFSINQYDPRRIV